ALLARDDVAALLMYLETVRDGSCFRAMAARARSAGKPIVLLKGGNSGGGQSAARSHTGALANDEAVFAAICRNLGVCRVDTIAEACDCLHLFERQALFGERARDPQPLAIASTSGGASVLAADECARAGIRLASFGPYAQDEIRNIVPRFGRAENPIDVTGQIINEPDLMEKALAALLSDDEVGGLLVLVTMVTGEQGLQVARALARARTSTEKLIAVAWTAPAAMIAQAAEILAAHNVPLFDDPVRAVRALSKLHGFLRAALPHEAADGVSMPDGTGAAIHSEVTLRCTLRAAGLPLCREEIVQSADEGAAAARRIGFPVVAKIVSPNIPHKSDAGLVRAPLGSPEAVRHACIELLARARDTDPRAHVEGVAVQELVKGVGEALVAIKRDPQFGPVLVLGMGGLFAEVWQDAVVVPLPTSREEIERALRSLRGYAMWRGARGQRPADVEALIETALRTAHLAQTLSERLRVLEFNPVILREGSGGAAIVDVLWSE
ncbi:CoA-binding protein, partial [bacterium]